MYRDNFGGSFTVYRAPLSSFWVNKKESGLGFGPVGWHFPLIRQLGGNSKRVLFAVKNDGPYASCLKNIIIANRATRQTKKVNTELCIKNTLDEHDFTRFFGIASSDKSAEIGKERHIIAGIGDYLSGKTIATTTVLFSKNEHFLGRAVSDWEISNVLFMTGICNPRISNNTFLRIYDFNTKEGKLFNLTPRRLTCQSIFNSSGGANPISYKRGFNQTAKEGSFILKNTKTEKEEKIIIP